MSWDKFSVLYTHQKTKKAKTWQDGSLKIIGTKAILYDEESKTLDSLFVQGAQVTLGAELESDRYLITIEEKLQHSICSSQETAKKLEEEQQESKRVVYQPAKRKRQSFQPPFGNQTNQTCSSEPDMKKPREENPVLRLNRFALGNKPSAETEFFNMYRSNSNKREQYLQAIQREECQHGMRTVLRASNEEHSASMRKKEQHDQRVPTNVASQKQTTGKENLAVFIGTSSDNLMLQTQNECVRDSKRNASQILALFSSCKDIHSPKMMFHTETAQMNVVNIESGNSLSKRRDVAGDTLPKMSDLGNYSHAKRISHFSDVPQKRLGNDSFEAELEWSQDLSDLLDLSPDSFAACSGEREAEGAISGLFDFNGGVTSGEAGSQESFPSKQHSSLKREIEVWSENDSESISPVMSLLNDGEKDVMGDENCTAFGLKERRAVYCDMLGERRQVSWENLQSPDRATVRNPCSDLHSSHSPTHHKSGDGEMVTSEGRSDFPLGIHQRNSCLEEKSSLESGSHNLGLEVNSNEFSNHPGSLFAYGALQTDPDDNFKMSSFSNLQKKEILHQVERCHHISEQKSEWDREANFLENYEASPEFYPAEITKMNEWSKRCGLMPRQKRPLVTMPPSSHDPPRTAFSRTDEPNLTEPLEVCRQTAKPGGLRGRGPHQRGRDQPEDMNAENFTEKRRDTTHSAVLGSCRRIGLRRVGSGSSLSSQARTPPRQTREGFRPPTLPVFIADRSSGECNMAGELSFPSAEHCNGSVTPTRHVSVPVTFDNIMQYRQVFKAALREHLNIVLFELSRTYHTALQKIDISGYDAIEQGSRENSDGPSCPHGQARLRAVKKDGPNKGRLFYTCPGTGQAQCKFFKWADEYQSSKQASEGASRRSSNKITLSSAEGLMSFFRSHSVSFYCECHLIRKQSDAGKGRFGAAKAKKWGRQKCDEATAAKKKLYLELSRKDHSSTYAKDDIWIISKTLSFNPDSTFIASSVYYGPSSTGELELLPISGYSPSNWQSGETVHALMACNAGTELTCISNIDEHVKMQSMPVLPYLLQRSQSEQQNLRSTSRATQSFVPPILTGSSGRLNLPLEVTESIAEEMIVSFSLNKDQAAALLSCARMFTSGSERSSPPVCLIHGVFGAGKSFLLAVVVLYLVELFKANDSFNQQSGNVSSWKILVSSTTNVAVDRILLGLLDLGFEEFVRVGSIRKIAKPVLPYSVHSTGGDSQELKELQSLLKTELTPSERIHVRKGIEQHKLGENKRKLSQVPVVGVTCAACVFPCLDKLNFPVLLLDECSQMTEPASLLPMARFECQKLVLVGDPKQLSPTIQGSEPDHESGLEQTLFDRLIKMGYEPTLLRTQYRCHPTISAISNTLFYGNKLLDGVMAEDRSPIVDIVPTLCFYNVARGKEKCGRDGSYYNDEEAKFVVFLIECLLESWVEPAQIGVITLYKSQLNSISNHLAASRATSNAELKSVQISTVDAFQGGEKDLIILSCVRTDHIGFIDCDRRTNVALTRAKRHLLIVGNFKMLSCNNVWGKVIEHCRGFPGGLCNSLDFVEKWKKEYANDTSQDPSPAEVTKTSVQSTNDKQSSLEALPSNSQNPIELRGEPDGKMVCSPGDNTNSVDKITSPQSLETSDVVDNDNDDELPTFDLFSLGIETV
ncbi:protein ZGRF1-like [Stylophora pistillata]|uniref:protein ZGRF1-like n=1 Tax=Stylophora pistillata TaxID=50429 RepID=UPI000C056B4A|nr:protein ZGRF1-like [Stylophora pistillata]